MFIFRSLDNVPVKRTREDFGDDFEVPKKTLASQVCIKYIVDQVNTELLKNIPPFLPYDSSVFLNIRS